MYCKPDTYRILTANTALWVVFVLFTLSGNAQTENKKLNLDEFVVTGQYGENSLNKSVYKVKVIDAKRIQLQGAFNLQQLLVNELNVRINQDPILGGSLQLQGVGGNNIKILIDGVPVIGRENGTIDLSQINLNNVERIELVEGPMSVNYGTDALGGVINIITKKQKQASRNARLNLYAESVGQYNADINIGAANQKYNLMGGFGRNFFAGYSLNPESRIMLWKPRTQYLADLNFGKTLVNGSFRWSNQFFTEKVSDKGEPTIDWTQAFAQDHYYYTTRYTSSFFLEKKYEGKRNINVVASYNFYQRKLNAYQVNLVELSRELIPSASEQDTNWFHQLMSRGTYANVAFSKKLSYQMGYDVSHEFALGKRIENKEQQMGDYSLFGSFEIKTLKRLLIRPAFRLTYNTRFSVPVIPSLNIKYDISENWILRTSYAHGFRAPSLKELYLQFVDISHNLRGNANLTPETSNNFQLNLMYQNKSEKRVWRFDPSVFYSEINNMIDFARIGSGNTLAYQYVNINRFKSTGINLGAEYRTQKYQIIVGYAVTGRENKLMQNTGNSRLFYSDEWRLNLGYNFLKQDAGINLFLKHNGKIQTYQYDYMSDAVILSYMNPFSLMDISMSKNLFRKKLALTFGSKNILNVQNVGASLSTGPHSGINNFAMTGMGRTYFVGLCYTIKK